MPRPSMILDRPNHFGRVPIWYFRVRDRPRFFDKVGHQTADTSIGNKPFFTK